MIPRQSMGAAAVVAAMVMPAAASAAQEQPRPQMSGVAQAAVTGCAQAHPMAEHTIDLTNRRLETARQANSPAAMRAAMDDLQAALRQLRTEIAPCAGLQSLAPTDPRAGHAMPSTAQAPAAVAPTAATQPGRAAPSPAPASQTSADPHAGHAMPAAPSGAAAAPRAVAAPRLASAATPRATDTQPRTTPSPAAAADPHAGHVMPAPPQAPAAAAEATPAVPAMTTVENPAARLADLMCQPQVDPDTAPRATYLGKAHYFCTAADRDLFLKAPAKYLQNR